MSGLRKDVNLLLATLQAPPYNCDVTAGRAGKWRVTREGYQTVSVSQTPSDRRAMQNILKDVRTYLGIDLKRA